MLTSQDMCACAAKQTAGPAPWWYEVLVTLAHPYTNIVCQARADLLCILGLLYLHLTVGQLSSSRGHAANVLICC